MACCATPRPPSRQPGVLATGRTAEIRRQETTLIFLGELVVDGQIAEVEEAIAHPGVFPVDDPDRRAVIDKARVQEIVVAEDGGLLPQRALDIEGDRPGPLL